MVIDVLTDVDVRKEPKAGVLALRNAWKVTSRKNTSLIGLSETSICTGLITKDNEKCIDRCGCEYPEGWSSRARKCRIGRTYY